jgi:uncharacterized cupin superfamily protein
MQRLNVLTGAPGSSHEVGLRWFGASVHELSAGQWLSPYHYHYGIEEWLYVVAGTPNLREPAGERTLARGEAVCFPSGPEGANAVGGPGRVVMFSGADSDRAPSVSIFAESGEIRVRQPGHGAASVDCRADEAIGHDGRDSTAAPRPVVDAMGIEVETGWDAPPGFQLHYCQLGPLVGGQMLGGAVWEFAPGTRSGPYHYHHGNEECLLVLAGTPTLRHPEGRDVLAVGDMVVFPEGVDGAHQLINESETGARALMMSTMREPYGCAYLDSGKVSTFGGIFRLTDTVDYWEGERAGADQS